MGGVRRFGRYVVVGELGAGGMGVVLAARDPELDRPVAIKLLRTERVTEASKVAEHTVRLDGDGRPRDLVREQLLAEGRAMARLSHPNLIAVYEVGEVDGQIFLAMEHIEGRRLGDWCRAGRRSWREIVGAFVQAGRGLSAAHAAGLVHGDFKPENALVDDTGRVRVIDFGLARPAGARAAGRLEGTPGFAAPETLRGRPADPLSDPFAFAVSLFHALYQRWPYAEPSDDGDPLARFAAGPRPAPRGAAPGRVERALRRALAPDPADRHRSMDELLAALDRDRSEWWRRTAAGSAAVVVAAGLALWAWPERAAGSSPECSGAAERLAASWSQARRDRLRAALVATGRPHAARTAELVAAALDDYAAAWLRERRAACDATLAGGGQPFDLLGRRLDCLDRRLAQLDAAAETMTRADGAVVDGAVRMASSLEPVADCARIESLQPDWPLPVDPRERGLVVRLTAEVDRAWTELRAGRPPAAAVAASVVLAQAPLVDRPPLFARASWVLGLAHEQLAGPELANQALLDALQLAERARDGEQVAWILIDLARVVGLRLKRPAEGTRLLGVARAALERIPAPSRESMRLRLLQSEGDVAVADGRPMDAERAFRAAVELGRELFEPTDLRVGDAESRLAVAIADLGRTADAREHNLRALAIREEALGPEHPSVAGTHNNLAEQYRVEGDLETARRHYQRSLAVLDRIPHHRDRPSVVTNLGLLEAQAGNLELARRHMEDGLAEREATLGPDHPDVANSLHNLGHVLYLAGDAERPLALFERALAIRGKRLGEEHALYARSLVAVSALLCAQGRWQGCLDRARRAERILAARVGRVDGHAAAALTNLGVALIALGRPGEAIADLERALPARIEGDAARAETAFALAQALWQTRADRPRALALAREARAALPPRPRRAGRETRAGPPPGCVSAIARPGEQGRRPRAPHRDTSGSGSRRSLPRSGEAQGPSSWPSPPQKSTSSQTGSSMSSMARGACGSPAFTTGMRSSLCVDVVRLAAQSSSPQKIQLSFDSHRAALAKVACLARDE